jgi:hypothetical protein
VTSCHEIANRRHAYLVAVPPRPWGSIRRKRCDEPVTSGRGLSAPANAGPAGRRRSAEVAELVGSSGTKPLSWARRDGARTLQQVVRNESITLMSDAEDESVGALAEFVALRAEILARQGSASSLMLYQLTSAAGVFSFALSDTARTPFLLVLPFTSYLLAWRYTMHSLATGNMAIYIRDKLDHRVPGGLGWESWNASLPPRISSRFFLSPNRLIFTGVALGAATWVGFYLASVIGSTIDWPRGVGLAILWFVGLGLSVESWRATHLAHEKWTRRRP